MPSFKSPQSKMVKDFSIASEAKRYLLDVSNHTQVEQAQVVLNALEDAVSAWQGEALPSIYAALSDLSSTLFLEWALPKSRLGFNIESDSNESGWYLLIEKADGQLLREWGYLTGFKAKPLVDLILNSKSI